MMSEEEFKNSCIERHNEEIEELEEKIVDSAKEAILVYGFSIKTRGTYEIYVDKDIQEKIANLLVDNLKINNIGPCEHLYPLVQGSKEFFDEREKEALIQEDYKEIQDAREMSFDE